MNEFFWIVADPHLQENNKKEKTQFFSFLELFNQSNSERLFILGDLFSNWVALENSLSQFQREILDELRKCKKEIIFIYGNRDYFIEELQNSPFVFSGKTFKIKLPSSKVVFFEHGETINLLDRKYLLWSSFSRMNAVKSLIKIFPENVIKKIREKIEVDLSNTNMENKTEIPLKYLRKYALYLKENRIETVFLGHFHKRLSFNFYSVKIEILDKFFPYGSYVIVDYEGILTEKKLYF